MSRNAIKGSMPIKGIDAENISNIIMFRLKRYLNVDAATLGSTGKKKPNDFSGDIDIAINMEFIPENIDKVKDFIYSIYGDRTDIYISHGFKIISFGVYYTPSGQIGENKLVQVDFMFTENIKYSKFMYHSPNYKENESDFKGLYRTNLLIIMAKNIICDIPTVYDSDHRPTDWYEYSLTYDKGLVRKHKTYMGKKKYLKLPKVVKDDTILITNDINKIIKFVLGDYGTLDDVNSYENLMRFLLSDKYKYGDDTCLNIIEDFLTDERHRSMFMDLTKFIEDEINKKDWTGDKKAKFLNTIGYIFFDLFPLDF